MTFRQWLIKRGEDPDALNKEQRRKLYKQFKAQQRSAQPEPQRSATGTVAPPPSEGPDESQRADEIRQVRQENELLKYAQRHGIDVTDLDLRSYANVDAGRAALMERHVGALEQDTTPRGRVGARTELTVAEEDKHRDLAVGAILHNARFRGEGLADIQQDNHLRGRSLSDIVRGYAIACGEDAALWSRNEIAYYALGRYEKLRGLMKRANVFTDSFASFVFANALEKAVALGYDQSGRGMVVDRISSRNTVSDFKQFKLGSLVHGNLTQLVQGQALPELTRSEGVYNSSLNIWGGTIFLTFEAMVSDDTGELMRGLQQAGLIARATEEKEGIKQLLLGPDGAGAWTDNVTSSATIAYSTGDTIYAARQNLGKTKAAMMTKKDLNNENPLSHMPVFLLVPAIREAEARGLMGQAPGGQSVQDGGSLEVLASGWLDSGSGLTGASDTSYYLGADPNMVDGLVHTGLQGFETPEVISFDTGASLDAGWKIFRPFVFDLVSLQRPKDSNSYCVPAFQRGDA